MTNPIFGLARICLLCAAISIIASSAAVLSFSETQDASDRLSQNNSPVFSPGYINAAKQKTEQIVNQTNGNKGFLESIADYLKNNTANKVESELQNKAVPELQNKSGAVGQNPNEEKAASAMIAATGYIVADSGPADLNIGSGTDQSYTYDKWEHIYPNLEGGGPHILVRDAASDKMISEVIDGKRYIYVGFDNIGTTLENAIVTARDGDTIIMKGGLYEFGAASTAMSIMTNFNLYGGYGESGLRDVANNKTTISGNLNIYNITNMEISGFSFSGSFYFNDSRGVTMRNNTFTNSGKFFDPHDNRWYYTPAIMLYDSKITVSNNTFFTAIGIQQGNMDYNLNNNGRWTSNWWMQDSSNVISRNNNYYGDWALVGCFSSAWRDYSTYNSVGDYFDLSRNGPNLSGNIYGNQDGGLYDDIDYYSYDMKSSANSYLIQQTTPKNAAITTSYPLSSTPYDIYQSRRFDSYSSLANFVMNAEGSTVGSVFKALLVNKDSIMSGSAESPGIDQAALAKLMRQALGTSSVSMPLSEANLPQMEAAIKLTEIIKNPTEDQKEILDTVTALIADVDKAQKETGNAELQKAQDDLIQMVAAVLLAQALPDLLKEGDLANIKWVFSELKNVKGKAIRDYEEATKPYYGELRKTLMQDIAILQQKNILSKQMTKEELEKLPPLKIGEILDKLRKSEKKTFEEEYILQQEAKYREKYIDPNKKRLEDNMKTMLQQFSKRLYSTLDATDMK